MVQKIPLVIQTMYAELVERCAMDQMVSEFPPTGSFFTKLSHGGTFWYFRTATNAEGKRSDKYVGPDSDELRRRIEAHKQAKAGVKERRMLVNALLSAGLHRTDARTGRVLEALAEAGVFRLRAVVVGTTAYQTYAGLLAVLMPSRSNAITDDLNIAQFTTISIALEDRVDLPFGDILKKADPRFEPVPHPLGARHTTHYAIGGNEFRVDLLTPRHNADERPVNLPALQTEAHPLPFLDFLIYQEVQAVALYGSGVSLNVPTPERYALHKLLVSRLRMASRESQTKSRKDILQAAELLDILCEQRPYELRDLWQELTARGPKWRTLANEAMSLLDGVTGSPTIRERLIKTLGERG